MAVYVYDETNMYTAKETNVHLLVAKPMANMLKTIAIVADMS